MSKNNNRDYNDRNQTTQTETENEREPFVIEVETANFEDRATGHTDFIISTELCDIVNNIFRPVFDDYEGSKFIVDRVNNNCYIELWFHHRLQETEDSVFAFSQNAEVSKYSNKTVQRVMTQDKYYREGISYHPTLDAKDGIAKYIMPAYKNKKGEVSWKEICADICQPTNNYATNFNEVLSRIAAISPNEILKARFGTQNSKGANVQYQVMVLNSLPSISGKEVFLLSVTQVDETQLDRSLRNAGIVNPNGLGIIK